MSAFAINWYGAGGGSFPEAIAQGAIIPVVIGPPGSGGGGGVTDGDKGDIVVSGAGAIWSLDPAVVASFDPAGAATGTIAAHVAAPDPHPQYLTAAEGSAAFAPLGHTHVISDVTGLITALAGKEPTITSGTAAQYLRGDKSLATLDKTAVGLTNVDNTSDASKPVSTAVATALAARQPLATVLTNTTAAFTTAQETKLTGIAIGATANATDAQLRDRSTHTGTQPIGTIAGNLPVAQLAGGVGASATTYWRGDGTWAAVSGGGGGTVNSVAVTTANGVSASVANPTTTPVLTFTLGAITPASIAATGVITGSNLSGTNTGDQTSVTGNAGTATALQTARTINGVAFDGTANITISAVDATARVPAARSILTTAPLGGGGTLAADLTLTIAAASGSAAGTMSSADFTKLAGIAAGATANATDAQLRDRATHTGTQLAATISDFVSAARAQTEGGLVAGSNITITPSGTGATRQLTIASTASGGGSASFVRPVEINFGAQPVVSGNLVLSGFTGLTVNAPVQFTQALGPYTGKGTLADEFEMDSINVAGVVTSPTQITAFWRASAPIAGNVRFLYEIGPVTLAAPSFSSTTLTIGAPSSGTINNVQPGATLSASPLPPGFTVSSSAPWTWAYDGTGTAQLVNTVLTVTLEGATNSPLAVAAPITVATGSITLSYSYAQISASLTGSLRLNNPVGKTSIFADLGTTRSGYWSGVITGTDADVAMFQNTNTQPANLVQVSIDNAAFVNATVVAGRYQLFSGLPQASRSVIIRVWQAFADTGNIPNSGAVMSVTGTPPSIVVYDHVQPVDGNALVRSSNAASPQTNSGFTPATVILNGPTAAQNCPSVGVRCHASELMITSRARYMYLSAAGAAPVRYDAGTASTSLRSVRVTGLSGLKTYFIWTGANDGVQLMSVGGVTAEGFVAHGVAGTLDQYGDSITQGVLTTTSTGEVEMFGAGAALNRVGGNFGVSGNTIAQLLARVPTILAGKTVTPTDVAVIAIGRNNVGAAFDAQTTSDYQAIVNALVSAGYGRIICRGILPEGANTWPAENGSISSIVTGFANPKVVFCDTSAWSGIGRSDGVHPNDAGYATLRGYAIANYPALIGAL